MKDMRYEIIGRPYYAMIKVSVEIGDRIFADLKSMVSIDTNIKWKDSGDQNDKKLFYVETYPGELILTSKVRGDIYPIDFGGQTMYVRSNSLLASYGDISVDSNWGGSKEFFSEEKITLLKISGKGTIFLTSDGILYKKWVEGTYFVEENKIVVFEEILRFRPTPNFDDEGRLFIAFNGGGNLYIQTR
jgi:uncharacterized protein (AIM24 family)